MQRHLKIAATIAITGLLSLPVFGVQESGLLIENVTLIDGTEKAPQANASVLVQGDRILRVRDRTIQAPSGTQRIDGTGKS